jgi:hypothetical protein
MPRAAARQSPLRILALTLSAALFAAPALADFPPGEDLCLDRWRCAFEHVNATTGQTWRWDLSTLCRPLNGPQNGTYSYSGPGTEGQTFQFNVCGNTSAVCSDYANTNPMYESVGVATQFFQAGRGTRSNADTSCLREDGTTPCPDYTFGGSTCCSTRRCEVVAVEAFRFDIVDPSNPASGGIVLIHEGFPGSDNDANNCPDQAPGLRRQRQFILTLQCDPNGKVDDLTVTSYDETSQYCIFRLTATTKAACGIADAPPSSGAAAAAGSNQVGPAGQFGFTILGAVLAVGLQFGVGVWRAGGTSTITDTVNSLFHRATGSRGGMGSLSPGKRGKGEAVPLRFAAAGSGSPGGGSSRLSTGGSAGWGSMGGGDA